MQQVITAKQAREITGGRKPLVPVVYEEAVKALGECLTLDDAKYWDNKADALAAWAKIYHDDKVARQAKALKLHAYRRMGELALALGRKPGASQRISGGRPPMGKGAVRILSENYGLSRSAAGKATRLARILPEKFEAMAKADRVPGISTAVLQDRNARLGNNGFAKLFHVPSGGGAPGNVAHFRMFSRRVACKEAAAVCVRAARSRRRGNAAGNCRLVGGCPGHS